ncbi:MAG: GFA family protein [Pseudomonadota bacterium]
MNSPDRNEVCDGRHGGCLCGAVRYRAVGHFRDSCFCHCESCRRAAGATPVAWGTVDLSDFHVEHGELTVRESSKGVKRGFCSRCGSAITYWHHLRGEEIDITLASLDNPASVTPEDHIWVCDKPGWVVISDELPQYATVRQVEQ